MERWKEVRERGRQWRGEETERGDIVCGFLFVLVFVCTSNDAVSVSKPSRAWGRCVWRKLRSVQVCHEAQRLPATRETVAACLHTLVACSVPHKAPCKQGTVPRTLLDPCLLAPSHVVSLASVRHWKSEPTRSITTSFLDVAAYAYLPDIGTSACRLSHAASLPHVTLPPCLHTRAYCLCHPAVDRVTSHGCEKNRMTHLSSTNVTAA